jgi:hypothetical protein
VKRCSNLKFKTFLIAITAFMIMTSCFVSAMSVNISKNNLKTTISPGFEFILYHNDTRCIMPGR